MKQLILLLLLPLLVLPLVHAQVFEGITADNSTNTNPIMDIQSQPLNQGALLSINGANISPESEVNITMYHPDGTKFGIFKVISTKHGAFQIPVEIAHTSKQGLYTIDAVVNGINLVKKFTYAGAAEIAVYEPPVVIPEIPEPIPTNSTSIDNSTSTDNSTSVEPIPESEPQEQTNWDVFIRTLDESDRLDLINAIIRYLLS